ncbi:MAG: conjugative transposon protein TraM [Bacteroidales bacterium]|nr:conjugative transposon protein TraM [Bacteroidales bacterium]MBR5834907.1 conjugative transposon protein TraM [Bacteroidales bacterium]
MKDKKSWMLFVLMLVALVGLLWLVFLPGCRDETAAEKVAMDVPEGIAEEIPESKREAYQEKGRKSVSTDEYFEMLMAEEEISLVSSEKIPGQAGNDGYGAGDDGQDVSGRMDGVMVQPGKGGSAAERVFGPAPVERSVPKQSGGSSGSGDSSGAGGYSGAVRQGQMSEEKQLEYDRKRAEMVRDVITGTSSEAEGASSPDSVDEDEVKLRYHSDDDIVFSLDDEFTDDGVNYPEDSKRPFRCMFIRDEKLKEGQRVTLRLLETYEENGVRIPANSHLNAICKIGNRLELNVKSVEMNGKIIPLNLYAYDTDGLKGIYCPETSSNKNAKKAENDVLSASGATFGGLVGDIANTIIRTGVNIARSSSGEVSVNVSSGYEFFLVKSERR